MIEKEKALANLDRERKEIERNEYSEEGDERLQKILENIADIEEDIERLKSTKTVLQHEIKEMEEKIG